MNETPSSGGVQDGRVTALIAGVDETIRNQRWPRATYRVQFNAGFPFPQATARVDYWERLGVSDVYASPYLKAVPGSQHGYDIVDHSVLNPDLGSLEDFQAFTAALEARGLGHLLDCVPNHMGVNSDANLWWQDVLENGPGSRYAAYFDIDWNPPKQDIQDKLLLPVLGEQFGQVLESGQLQLEFEGGLFWVRYFSRRFPIAPKSCVRILEHRLPDLTAAMPADDPSLLEYQSIITALVNLPARTETDPQLLELRYREKEVVKRRLSRLCEECPFLQTWIQETLTQFNGRPGEPRSFDQLDALLAEQAYRLSFWRVAADEINYRRFFDVNELAAVCMERPEVFERAHELIFRLLKEGHLSGLRIDHADGLYDPTAYLWQLQQRRFLQLCEAVATREGYDGASGPIDWAEIEPAVRSRYAELCAADPTAPLVRPLYLIVEKILERSERLPQTWPVHGTTGYDFLNDVNDLFVDHENARTLDAIYARFLGSRIDFGELVYEAKRLILRASMSSELHVLGHALDRISERNRWTRDFTLHGQIQALREVIACFPVYRTYTVGQGVLDRDRRYVEQAVARARRRNPEMSATVFDFVRDVLLLQGSERLTEEERTQRQSFIGRFQQLTGPMMAKAVEDTVYYRFHRLISLNEVGGDPERVGISVEEFHQLNQERRAQHPQAMLTTSTHDTKRSEDVRARINVLSEVPQDWKSRVARWARWNKRKKAKLEGEMAPARNDEYLLYQTLVGTWPLATPQGPALAEYVGRIQRYMIKAVREAKQYTSWIAPNDAYEKGLQAFIEAILAEAPLSAFRADFEPFAAQVAHWGLWNSLGQSLLKLTSPGIPDLYQGMEVWGFFLVDPDNRQPVDYDRCERLLADLDRRRGEPAVLARELCEQPHDGAIKLWVHHVALEVRRQDPALFTEGEYIPVPVSGSRARHVCAFLRRRNGAEILVVVPRLIAQLVGPVMTPPVGEACWEETAVTLPSGSSDVWRNRLSGRECRASASGMLRVADLLGDFPVGLLEGDPEVRASE